MVCKITAYGIVGSNPTQLKGDAYGLAAYYLGFTSYGFEGIVTIIKLIINIKKLEKDLEELS